MTQTSKVALVACSAYNEESVSAAVQRGIDLLGGMASFITPGEKILLKPNVLVGDAPEKLVSPHPLVFKAVAQLAQQVTPNLTYGDSPGFGKPAGQVRRAKLAQAVEDLGIPLADFEHGREVLFKDSPFIKHFTFANGVLDADGIISICKFKAHQLTRLTGAVKNQFGCVPGALKAEYHIKLPNAQDFAKMLVCITLYLRPRLYVMDGIIAMQGNGPRSGEACPLKLLLFSNDPVAMDAAMCRIIGMNPEFVPTNIPGREWGLGTYITSEIEWLGDPVEMFVNKNFSVVRAPVEPARRLPMLPFVKNLLSPHPTINAERCTRCGTCVHSCPVSPKAVDWFDGDRLKAPSYKYDRCIRCFCCQELCPEGAITVETPMFGRLLGY